MKVMTQKYRILTPFPTALRSVMKHNHILDGLRETNAKRMNAKKSLDFIKS